MIDKTKIDWKKYLVDCMRSTEYCCLATVDKNGVWSNPVYFAWDGNFNLYFISQPNSRHMRNLEKDSRVAISIYTTARSTFGDVAGIQLDGNAYILTNKQEVEKAYDTYYGRKYLDTSKNPKKDEDAYINNPEWIFVKIVPEHIYYFDTRFFDEERQEVPEQILRNNFYLPPHPSPKASECKAKKNLWFDRLTISSSLSLRAEGLSKVEGKSSFSLPVPAFTQEFPPSLKLWRTGRSGRQRSWLRLAGKKFPPFLSANWG